MMSKILLVLVAMAFLGMSNYRWTESPVEKEAIMDESIVITENTNFFVQKLNVQENPARGAAERLSKVGCGRINEIRDLDDSDGAYSMDIIDEKGDCYNITMSYEGYLGVVIDEEGKYLVMPID